MKEWKKNIYEWIKERLHAFRNLEPKRRNYLIGMAIAVGAALFLCLLSPGLILRMKDRQFNDVVQTAYGNYTARTLMADTTMDNFYNRLFLISGQWEGDSETGLAEIEYSTAAAESMIGRINIGMRDSYNVWHGNEQILEQGNCIRAVCNLEVFGLMPDWWNFYYNSWTLNRVEGTIFRETFLQKYSCTLWCFCFVNPSNPHEVANVYIDDITGNLVGIRVGYNDDEMMVNMYNQVWSRLQNILAKSSGTANERLHNVLNNYFNYSNGYKMFLRLEALSEIQEKNSEVIANGEKHMAASTPRTEESPEENISDSISSAKGLGKYFNWSRTENNMANEEAEAFLNMIGGGAIERETIQSHLTEQVSTFLDRLGYCDVVPVTDEETLQSVHVMEPMEPIDSNAYVFACTEFATGDEFFFVVHAGTEWMEAYFATKKGNSTINDLTEE